MEWSKIKTILIWIFAIVNIFLLSIYFREMNMGKTLDDNVINSTIEILKQNKVSIDKDVIPKTLENVKICSVENECADINAVIERTTFNKQNVSIEGNGFVYKPNGEDVREGNTEDMLKQAGLITHEEYKKVKTKEYEYYYLRADNKVFFDSYIRVKTANGVVEEIYCKNWLKDHILEEGVAESVSPAEILIDFSAQYGGEKIKVNKVESGYYIGERTGNVRITASPAWEISVSDGTVFYYDMRNGDLLK